MQINGINYAIVHINNKNFILYCTRSKSLCDVREILGKDTEKNLILKENREGDAYYLYNKFVGRSIELVINSINYLNAMNNEY